MGVAAYPRIENTEAGWVQEISGKALAKNIEKLFAFTKKEGRKNLLEYYVPSQEDLDDWNVEKEAEMIWFNPMEGITLLEAMTRTFHEHRDQFEHPEYLETDLNAFRSILEHAASKGLRWNLGMSY